MFVSVCVSVFCVCVFDEVLCLSYLMNHTVIDYNEPNCFEYSALGSLPDEKGHKLSF